MARTEKQRAGDMLRDIETASKALHKLALNANWINREEDEEAFEMMDLLLQEIMNQIYEDFPGVKMPPLKGASSHASGSTYTSTGTGGIAVTANRSVPNAIYPSSRENFIPRNTLNTFPEELPKMTNEQVQDFKPDWTGYV